MPRRSRRNHEGILVHCSTTLTDDDVTEVNNIPCTTVARTLLDLAEVVAQRQHELRPLLLKLLGPASPTARG